MATPKKQQKEVPFIGQATHEQVAAWEKQHGKVYEINVEVEDEQGNVKEIAVCYVHKPSREHYALGIQYYHQDRLLQMGEVITRNCWLAGDERLKPEGADPVLSVSAALQAKELFMFNNAYIKNSLASKAL